jgi:hypothetical protein
MKVLALLPPEDADTGQLIQEFWEQLLFEWGFPSWLIDHVIERHFNWTKIIRDLYGAEVVAGHGDKSYVVPSLLQGSMLKRLTALAMTESENTVERERLRRSLQLDGFEISERELAPAEGPISIAQEKGRVLKTLAASSFARKDLIAKHLKDAQDHFSNAKAHSVMSESRSALQASVEDTVSLIEKKGARKSGGGLKNQIEFLVREKFISDDEQQAFLAAWGFLSAGAHPGLPPDEAGRIALIFGLEFTHVLLFKAKNLA